MLVRLLVADPTTNRGSRRVESHVVTVPAGTRAGDSVSLTASWGGSFAAVVPPGLQPGDMFEAEVEA